MDYKIIAEQAMAVAKKAGDLITNKEHIEIYQKEGHANFVTSMDLASQKLITENLADIIPGANIVGEESSDDHALKAGANWIIDPIDGTTNYIKGFKHSSISIALVVDGETQVGIVYDPYLKEMFHAVKDGGAFCNNEKIHAANTSFKDGVVTFGSAPYYSELKKKSYEILSDVGQIVGDTRRLASAALDLCYLGCGRSDGFFEMKLQIWDFAAGNLIAKEGGAIVEPIPPDKFDFTAGSGVMGGSPTAYPTLKKIILSHLK